MAQGRRVNAHLEILVDNHAKVAEAVKRLANTTIMVGIPSDDEQPHYDEQGGQAKAKNKRDDDVPVNNADLGYIHETGAPAANIPARPWLSPGVRESRHTWLPYLVRAGKLAFEGRPEDFRQALMAGGQAAVSGIKVRIVAGIPPPLSPVTVARRRIRSAGSSYRRRATTASDTTPLVDTAQMLNSVSFVLRFRGRNR